jgi:SAM-dependent methyltransferase
MTQPTKVVQDETACPYCRTISGFYFSFQSRSYNHCPSCDLIFARRDQDPQRVITYYKDRYFDEYAEDQLSGSRSNLFSHILDLIENHKKTGTLLDVGCGCGLFLKEARERGWRVTGVDPSEKSIGHAKSLFDDTVFCGTLDEIPSQRRFDVITMINVFDHMIDAFQEIRKARDFLMPDGVLYLRFPNGFFHGSFIRRSRFLPKQFIHSFLIFHEYAITPLMIRRLLNDLGFAPIHVSNSHLTGFQHHFLSPNFGKRIGEMASQMIFGGFKLLEILSRRRWVWGPSLQVIALKGKEGHNR